MDIPFIILKMDDAVPLNEVEKEAKVEEPWLHWKSLVNIPILILRLLALNEWVYCLFFIKWVFMPREWLFHYVSLCYSIPSN